MSPNLAKALRRDFSFLFGGMYPPFPADRYEPVLRRLAGTIEPLLARWWEDLDARDRYLMGRPHMMSIKETPEGLKFYMTYIPEPLVDEIEEALTRAEEESHE